MSTNTLKDQSLENKTQKKTTLLKTPLITKQTTIRIYMKKQKYHRHLKVRDAGTRKFEIQLKNYISNCYTICTNL